ncbi:pyrimidine-nucleoside phosphorylase [Desulfotomaculum defluvii]
MRMVDIILKKRRGQELSSEEIEFFVQGYTQDHIPDYQAAAFLMAAFFQGLSPRETGDLTISMARSGDQADLSGIPGIKVDKHSTGGVGDKVTLILGPLVAAAGVPVAKMSGRGLGHTGGTIDKLESIPGFQVTMDNQSFLHQVKEIKLAVVAQTGHLAPADKKLYALRDVTATVDSIPLIAASVMSKKIAAGADAIVLDVKVGSGAFMKNSAEAFVLARTMVEIGHHLGRQTVALVTDMDQPLGFAIGNALEVKEAIETLRGNGPADLKEICIHLGSEMLNLAGIEKDKFAARRMLEDLLAKGSALKKFQEFVRAQGGNPSVVDNPSLLPHASLIHPVTSLFEGYVKEIQSEQVGVAAMWLGAGRTTKESNIDLSAGLVLRKKIGDYVHKGEVIAELHYNDNKEIAKASDLLSQAYVLQSEPVVAKEILLGKITEDDL